MRFAQSSIFTKALFAVVTALSILPASAVAQEAAGRFTLTHPARWGSVALSPGTYTYNLEHYASEMLLVRAADGQRGFLVMVQSISTVDDAKRDELVLQRDGDEWFVSSITLSDVGQTLHFAADSPHTQIARAATQDKLASLSKP
jgi:hypothetical protein